MDEEGRMTPEEIELLAEAAVRKTLESIRSQDKMVDFNKCPHRLENHKSDHDFVAKAIEVLGKLDDVRWGVLKALIIALALSLMAFAGFKVNDGGG